MTPSEKFSYEIISLLKNYPYNDGFNHPAMDFLAEAVGNSQTYHIKDFIDDYIEKGNLESRPHLFADFLCCLSCVAPEELPWRKEILHQALLSKNIVLRNAAINTLERWANSDEESLNLLRSHRESVPWLADYVRRVLEEYV